MAGMLPGVEHARRRRFHQRGTNWLDSSSTSGSSSSRRSSCIYTSSRDQYQYHLSSRSCKQNSAASDAYRDEKLVEIAREAKQRLDEKLSSHWKSGNKRSTNVRQQRQRPTLGVGDMQKEVFGLKKSVSKRFSWVKLGWKASEQDECAICLDQFRMADNLMQLRCAHKFHSNCLVPWLESNSHCPCCRMETLTTLLGQKKEKRNASCAFFPF